MPRPPFIMSKFRPFPLAAALLAAAASVGCCFQHRSDIKTGLRTPADLGPASLRVHAGIPVVHLYGTPEQMGTQYGTLLKKPLHALVDYVNFFLPDIKLRWLEEEAMAAEPSLPEDLRRQMKALATAAGLRYETVVALNLLPKMHCSTLASWGPASADGRLLMGRNSDYWGAGLSDRLGLIAVYHPSEGHALISVNFLGMIGAFTGMNDRGVCFGNMLVFNAKHDGRDPQGLTIQLLMRQAGHQADDAEAFLRVLAEARHAIPMNVMAADPGRAAVIELSPTDPPVVRRAEAGQHWLAASNHFRSAELSDHPVSCHRYEALAGAGCAADAGPQRMTATGMERALHAARMRGINLQAVVFEPAAGRIHVGINSTEASGGPYVCFDAAKLFAGAGDPVVGTDPRADR